MNVTASPGSSPTTVSPTDDAVMMSLELFDESGRWNPRKVLILSGDPAQQTRQSKFELINRFMRWHAKVWTVNFAKAHLKDNPRCEEFLRNVKKEGFVRRSQFLDMLTDQALRGLIPSDSSAQKPKSLVHPSLANLRETIIEHLRSMEWEKLDERFFKHFGEVHAESMARFIGSLNWHQENTPLVAKMLTFVDSYENWSSKQQSELAKENKNAAHIMRKAIFGYIDPVTVSDSIKQESELSHLTDSIGGPKTAELPSNFEEHINRQFELAKHCSEYEGSNLQKFEQSLLLYTLQEEDVDAAVSHVADVIGRNQCRFETIKELIDLKPEDWKKMLMFLPEGVADECINRLDNLRHRLNEIQQKSEIIRQKEEGHQQKKDQLGDMRWQTMEERRAAIDQLDWGNENVMTSISPHDCAQIIDWVSALNPRNITVEQRQLIEKILGALEPVRNTDKAKNLFLALYSIDQEIKQAEVLLSRAANRTNSSVDESSGQYRFKKALSSAFAQVDPDNAAGMDFLNKLQSSHLLDLIDLDDESLRMTLDSMISNADPQIALFEAICAQPFDQWSKLLVNILGFEELRFLGMRIDAIGSHCRGARLLARQNDFSPLNLDSKQNIIRGMSGQDRDRQFQIFNALQWENFEFLVKVSSSDAKSICEWIKERHQKGANADEKKLIFRILEGVSAARNRVTETDELTKQSLRKISDEAKIFLGMEAFPSIAVTSGPKEGEIKYAKGSSNKAELRKVIEEKLNAKFNETDSVDVKNRALLNRLKKSKLLHYLIADEKNAIQPISNQLPDMNELSFLAKLQKKKGRDWVSELTFLSKDQRAFVRERVKALPADLPKIRAMSDMRRIDKERDDQNASVFITPELTTPSLASSTSAPNAMNSDAGIRFHAENLISWNAFDRNRPLEVDDINLISDWIKQIDPSAADNSTNENIQSLLDLCNVSFDQADAFFATDSARKSYKNLLQANIMLPAMRVLRDIAARSLPNSAPLGNSPPPSNDNLANGAADASRFILNNSDSDSDSDEDDR